MRYIEKKERKGLRPIFQLRDSDNIDTISKLIDYSCNMLTLKRKHEIHSLEKLTENIWIEV